MVTAAQPRAPAAEAVPAQAAAGVRPRIPYLDRLKYVLVAVIIAAHGALAYGDLESAWPYQDVQETQLSPAADLVLAVVVIPAVLFTMGLFFLVAGLLTPASLDRKGPGRFARERLVRLGGPLLIWTLVIWPGSIWIAYLAAGHDQPFWDQLLDDEPVLDTGPMWFVTALLAYSLAYAGWCAWARRRGGTPRPGRPISGRTLAALACLISLATALVRMVFPIASPQVGQSHLWQWPQFIAMFWLGIAAYRGRSLDPVPARIRRGCGTAALAALAGWGAIGAAVALSGTDFDQAFETEVHWVPVSMALIEGPLAVGASVWLLAAAQARLNRPPGALGSALARSAYAAFVLQGVVLIALMVAMRPVEIPAEAKALIAGLLGAAGSFALAWLAVTRTPLRRIL